MDKYKVKLQFKNGNQTVEMGKGFDLRLLEKPTGLDGFEYEVKTNERNHYDGDDVESKRIGKRPIAVTFECPNVEKASEIRDQLLRFSTQNRRERFWWTIAGCSKPLIMKWRALRITRIICTSL